MRTTFRLISLSVILATAACSSAPPRVEQAAPKPAVTATAVAAPAFDLSPVPAPTGVFATGRAKSLTATIATLGFGGAQSDLTTATLRELTGRGGLRLDVDASKAASVVALDAPVDFVAAMPTDGPPEPMMAVAVGLKSLDEAKIALGATRELAPGMWAFGGERAKAFCVVAVASGPVPARAVCGPSERDVQALGGYLTRTLSTQASPASDVTLELLVSPLNARFGADLAKLAPQAPRLARSELGIGEPQFDRAIEAGARGLTDEAIALFADVDKVSFNVTLSPQGGVNVEGAVDYKSKTSWIARETAAAMSGPFPALFFQAPADADSVTFGRIVNPNDYAPMLRVGKDLIEGGLAKLKVGSEAERKKLSALLDFPLLKGEQIVSATGNRMISKPSTPKSASEKIGAIFDTQMGWNLIGSNQKADAVAKWLKDAAGAYAQPGMQKELKKALSDVVPTVKTPAPPAKLGKGAFEMDIGVVFGKKHDKRPDAKRDPKKDAKDAKSDKAPASVTFYILVMADGDSSWVAFGGNREELVERLLGVKSGAPKDKTVDGRADAQSLKSLKVASGGFMTLGSFRALAAVFFIRGSGGGSEDDMLDVSGKMEKLFQGLPNKGQTPIVYQGTVSEGPFRSRFSLNIPKASLDDFSALMNVVKGNR